MSKDEAEKFMHYGSLAAFIAALLGALIVALDVLQKPDAPLPAGIILYIALIVALGFGLRKKSRVCGSLLSALLLVSMVWRMVTTRNLGTSLGGFAITFFIVLGTYAAFRWHSFTREPIQPPKTMRVK
jgi:hypothetical protein